jgi:hypothetical protein
VPLVFWSATFEEVQYAAAGYTAEATDRERAAWERARWTATIGLQPHTAKGKHIKPADLCTFPWEKTTTKKGNHSNRVALAMIRSQQDGTK